MGLLHTRIASLTGKLTTALRVLLRPRVDGWQRLDACDVLLVCHDVDRGIVVEGKAYSPLLDSLGDDLKGKGWRCATFALPYSGLTGARAHGSPVNANRLMLLASALKRPTNPDAVRDAYRKVLRRADCCCIISIGAPEALCRAAHDRGIVFVELLHSMGYTPLPWGYDERDAEALPDVILSLDPVSTATFSQLAARGVEVKEIPHPWLSRFVGGENLPREFTKRPRPRGAGVKTILLSLQWGYDGDYPPYDGIIENGVLSPALERLIERTQGAVRWLLRLHPVQLRNKRYGRHIEFCERLAERTDNCEWRDASTLPIPMLLNECDGHITMSSMTTYEAAYFGVPTLLLCPSLRNGAMYESMFADLKREGFAQLGSVSDESAIFDWVASAERVAARGPQTQASWESVVQRLLGRVYK